MNDIQVGEYVRDEDGLIFKANEIKFSEIEDDYWICEKVLLGNWKSNIVKHSKNLIDLIECGDILEIQTGLYNKYKIIIEDEDKLISVKESMKNWTIKQILTHEQYNANCYTVKED